MNNVFRLIGMAVFEFKTNGIFSLLQKTIRRIKTKLFYTTCSTWYKFKQDANAHITALDKEYKIEFLVEDKSKIFEWLHRNKETFPWIYFSEEVDSATTYNHIYATLFQDDIIVGYVKIGVDHTYIHDFHGSFYFDRHSAFIYDTFVIPGFRGRKLARRMIEHVVDYLKKRNHAHIFCHIEKWNTPSIKAFKYAGFHPICTLRFVRIACFSFFLRNGIFPVLRFPHCLKRQQRFPANGHQKPGVGSN